MENRTMGAVFFNVFLLAGVGFLWFFPVFLWIFWVILAHFGKDWADPAAGESCLKRL